MSRPIKNPIVITFAALGAALMLTSILVGVPISQALQLIFVPYTYDITHGVGATGSKIYAATLGVMQLILIVLTISGVKSEGAVARRIIWGIGILLVIIYFVIIVLGYLINNFH